MVERIGEVFPQRHDLWWMLREGDPTVALAKQVVLAIEAHGLPVMRARML
jgi:hypothetical protein